MATMDATGSLAPERRPAPPRLRNGDVSFWHTSLGSPVPRPALAAPRHADVCVVGAGFTGLWTAYYLKRAAPHLEIVVLEERFSGYGASGRNGGFVMAALPGPAARYAGDRGHGAVVAMQQWMIDTVDEVIRVAAREGIEADLVKGGYIRAAFTQTQLERQASAAESMRALGMGDTQLLSGAQLAERIQIHGAVGGLYTPHCARVQPAKLVRGLADAVEALGVTIYESTPVTRIAPGRASTPAGDVEAPFILRATEAYSARIAGLRRAILPLNSSMVATERLAPSFWDSVGWAGFETVSQASYAYAYMQRTADDRLAIGIAAHPELYRFGSRTENDGAAGPKAVALLRRRVAQLFPTLAEHGGIEHAWSGVFGAPRDWCASVGLDHETGIAWAGGYAGHGVATANLAGRTVRDLILGEDTELVRLPWVGRPTRRWEPEPLRWIGAHVLNAAYRIADEHEHRAGRASPLAAIADKISGVAPL
jgi:glycine/D-amino acid oxidase-like deaminating enzyme